MKISNLSRSRKKISKFVILQNSLISDLESGGEKYFHALLAMISEDADVNDLVAWLELIIPALLTSSIKNSVEVFL